MKHIFLRAIIFLISSFYSINTLSNSINADSTPNKATYLIPGQIEWPNDTAKKLQIHILAGKFSNKPGMISESKLFSAIYKLPPNFFIPLHTHNTIENAVVLSSSIQIATGDKFYITKKPNKKDEKTLKKGMLIQIPKRLPHYLYAGNTGAEVLIYWKGPVDMVYLNRSKKSN